MTIDDAIAIVRDESEFCRLLAVQDGDNIGGDFAARSNRKAEAQETVLKEVERLRNALDAACRLLEVCDFAAPEDIADLEMVLEATRGGDA